MLQVPFILCLSFHCFEFNDKCYKQVIGASMGSKCSPEICDIRAFEVVKEVFERFPTKEKISFYGRYRDDGFIIYEGTIDELEIFFQIANSIHPLLKFTYNISETEAIFLDTCIYKGQRFEMEGVLDIKSYIKPTNTHQYLHRSSMHNPNVFLGLIRSETIRHIRSNSNQENLHKVLNDFKHYLIKRGYNERSVDFTITNALQSKRVDLLKEKEKKQKEIPLVFITKYHFSIRKLNRLLKKHWNKLIGDEDCKQIFNEKPMIAYSRHKNIKEFLTKSRLPKV